MVKVGKHLMIVSGALSWGRATMAADLGRELAKHGDTSHILSDAPVNQVFSKAGLSYELLPAVSGPLLGLFIEETVRLINPTSIILCDYRSVSRMLVQSGLESFFFGRFTVPVIGLELYDVSESGRIIDLFYDRKEKIPPSLEGVLQAFPVPISRIAPMTNRFCGFLAEAKHPTKPHSGFRRRLGLKASDKFVLVTTALWQHQDFSDVHAAQVQAFVPKLIADYVRSVPRLHLLHIGPNSFCVDSILGARYHWMETVTPDLLDTILSVASIYLSLTPLAMTQMRAILKQIPVILLQNSQCRPFSEISDEYHRHQGMLYPFSTWPLGYHAFFRRILDANPLMTAIEAKELLDRHAWVEALESLAFDKHKRSSAMQREADYVDKVGRLLAFPDLVRRLAK